MANEEGKGLHQFPDSKSSTRHSALRVTCMVAKVERRIFLKKYFHFDKLFIFLSCLKGFIYYCANILKNMKNNLWDQYSLKASQT